MKVNFPTNFLWGSSISSYQVEGDNVKSDWFLWERKNNLKEALKAADHYNLFSQDFDIAKSLGHNALRLSLEWGRVFPDKKTVANHEVEHYLRVVEDLTKKEIVPIVTLHHFTNPAWLSAEGGWCDEKVIDHFLAYVKLMASKLKGHVDFWITFNEPAVYIYNAFIRGIWPPGVKSVRMALKALNNILEAHALAYRAIKLIYGDKSPSHVSIAKHMRVFSPCPHLNFGQNNILAFLRNKIFNFYILDRLAEKRCLDFIGLNYYCREYVKPGIFLLGEGCKDAHHNDARTALNWFIYPEGLYEILTRLKKYKIPIIVTENGMPESKDYPCQDFLYSHLRSLAKALEEGVDVRGYMWWSLLDNFEWDEGYDYKFGLVKVDFDNFARYIRPFALEYKKICEENAVDI